MEDFFLVPGGLDNVSAVLFSPYPMTSRYQKKKRAIFMVSSEPIKANNYGVYF